MADEQPPKPATATGAQRRVRINAANMKSSYCNFFNARANPEVVVLNFGFDDLLGAETKDPLQVQMLHQVVLNVATARRVKDALVAILQQRDAGRGLAKAQTLPSGKSN